MPRRTLLSADARSRLFDIPTERAEMARHYVLDAADLALVLCPAPRSQPARLRRPALPAAPPRQGFGPGDHTPGAMLSIVAERLGVPLAAFADYAARDHDGRTFDMRALCGSLCNCTNVVSVWLCETLEVPLGSSYVRIARVVVDRLPPPEW